MTWFTFVSPTYPHWLHGRHPLHSVTYWPRLLSRLARLAESRITLSQPRDSEKASTVITSYSIHYTKLYDMRLNKVAREFNVGIHTIVEFLVITSYSIHYTKLYDSPEFHIINPDEIGWIFLGLVVKNIQTATLSHSLYQENAGHNRLIRKVSGKEGFINSHILYPYVITSYSIHYTKLYDGRIWINSSPDRPDFDQKWKHN